MDSKKIEADSPAPMNGTLIEGKMLSSGHAHNALNQLTEILKQKSHLII